jgi:hypothetical protein
MTVTQVVLTDSEKKLVNRIQFDPLKIEGGVDGVQAVCSAARELALSLLNRKAIPEHRILFFNDPDYNIGGHGSSRKQILERNLHGKDFLTSVHFLKYLQYFLFGPSLPVPVIDRFGEIVKNCGNVTSGDIIPLGDEAKKLVRKHNLERSDAAEEFYKLALEHGLQEYEARSIRDRVKKAK